MLWELMYICVCTHINILCIYNQLCTTKLGITLGLTIVNNTVGRQYPIGIDKLTHHNYSNETQTTSSAPE